MTLLGLAVVLLGLAALLVLTARPHVSVIQKREDARD